MDKKYLENQLKQSKDSLEIIIKEIQKTKDKKEQYFIQSLRLDGEVAILKKLLQEYAEGEKGEEKEGTSGKNSSETSDGRNKTSSKGDKKEDKKEEEVK